MSRPCWHSVGLIVFLGAILAQVPDPGEPRFCLYFPTLHSLSPSTSNGRRRRSKRGTLWRPPSVCPKVYADWVDKIEEHARQILTRGTVATQGSDGERRLCHPGLRRKSAPRPAGNLGFAPAVGLRGGGCLIHMLISMQHLAQGPFCHIVYIVLTDL